MSKLEYDDPVYRNTVREAVLILVLWVLAFAWVVPYCWKFGYGPQQPEDLKLILGIPDWVVWGVGAPWAFCAVVSVIASRWIIQDDILEGPHSDDAEAGSAATTGEGAGQ